MGARASVYYAGDYLTDVLLMEGVRVHAQEVTLGEGTKIAIALHDDDHLLDDLVASLTSLQRERRIAAARREVERLERHRKVAIDRRVHQQEKWHKADEAERAVHHELVAAQRALAALEGATE